MTKDRSDRSLGCVLVRNCLQAKLHTIINLIEELFVYDTAVLPIRNIRWEALVKKVIQFAPRETAGSIEVIRLHYCHHFLEGSCNQILVLHISEEKFNRSGIFVCPDIYEGEKLTCRRDQQLSISS